MNDETQVAPVSKTLYKDGQSASHDLKDVANALADGWSRVEPTTEGSVEESVEAAVDVEFEDEVEAETVVVTADDIAEVSVEDIAPTEPAEAKDG